MSGTLFGTFMAFFFIGIIWGVIDAWDRRAGFVLFVVVVLFGLVSYSSVAAEGETVALDVAEFSVGIVGFIFGYASGISSYKNTFEDNL